MRKYICRIAKTIDEQGIKMLKIGLCDDEEIARNSIKDLLMACFAKFKIEVEFEEFESAASLLSYTTKLDALLLDIDMPSMDGFEAAQELRKRGSKVEIIMATGMGSRFKEAFDIKALQFITKPFDIKEVEHVVNLLMKNSFPKKYLKIVHMRKEMVISQNDIISICTDYGGIKIYTVNNTYSHYESLEKIISRLNEAFICVNRTTILNIDYIADIKNDKEMQIKLINGEVLSVSRRRKREVNEYIIEYKLRQQS